MEANIRPRVEVPMYEGNLNVEELMGQINALNKYFDFEENKKKRYAATRMKGHVAIWWDELQIHRERRGKKKIKFLDKILYKIKIQIMAKDYQLNILRPLQNLRQKATTVKEYT